MKYESIIFDIDGTLWDSRALIAEGYNIQLRKEGLHHLQTNEDVLLQLFGRTMSDIADNLFPDFPPEERYALMDRCIASRMPFWSSIPAIPLPIRTSCPQWKSWQRSIVCLSSATDRRVIPSWRQRSWV